METLDLRTQWDSTEKVQLEISSYLNNGAMYIGLITAGKFPEPYGDMTVNLDAKAPDYCGYVDTNNMPELVKFIEENGIGEATGLTRHSGFCEYPLYLFHADRLRVLCPSGMAAYEYSIGADRKPEAKDKAR